MELTIRPLTLLASALLISAAYATDFEYCKKNAKYPVKVKGIEISPQPVARGEPATFSISATAGDTITKGKLVIDVDYWIIHVHEETHDLCTETSCPILTGDFVIAHEQTLPSFTPPTGVGHHHLHALANSDRLIPVMRLKCGDIFVKRRLLWRFMCEQQ